MKKALALVALVLLASLPGTAGAAFDRSIVQLWFGGAADTFSVGMAESSSVIWTRGAQRMVVRLLPNRPCRLAVEIKDWGDSLSDTINNPTANDTTKASIWPFNCPFVTTLGDTVSYRRVTAPTSVQGASYEAIVEFPDENAVAAKWGGPRQFDLDLHRQCDAVWCTADRIQVRVRVLGSGGQVKLRSSLKMYTW